ncbi:MAG: hypothetical protein H7223_00550 [Pedobacter sp.]|nr:hypothetical protein [Pedobacter sp.]
MYNISLGIVKDVNEAEDVLQEPFLMPLPGWRHFGMKQLLGAHIKEGLEYQIKTK